MNRSYYSNSIAEFCKTGLDQILGHMTRQNDFDLTGFQRDALLEQATLLQAIVAPYQGSIHLEFAKTDAHPFFSGPVRRWKYANSLLS